MAYDNVTSAMCDADSPINETLTQGFRNRDDALKTAITGVGGTLTDGHDHDGTTSAALAASTVGQSQLKTGASETSGSQSGTTTTITTQYAFFPRFKGTGALSGDFWGIDFYIINDDTTSGTTGTNFYGSTYGFPIHLRSDGGVYLTYLYYRYVTASPPHKLFAGDDEWWWFLWLLRDKSTGEIHSAHCADDPPWHFGHSDLPKGDVERIYRTPHPWTIDYPDPQMLDDAGLEIVLIDLRELNEAADVPSAEQVRYERMVARRDEREALGIPMPVILDAEEQARVAAEKRPTVKARGIDQARARADMEGRGLLEIVHGAVPPVTAPEIKIVSATQATRAIAKAQRDALPTVPVGPDSKRPWRDVVRVLQP